MLNDSRVFMATRLPIRLKWIVLGWLAAELLAFVALVQTIGLGYTVLLGIATTVLGFATMRRVGLETMSNLYRTGNAGQPPPGALADGMLAGLGAVLLILPGFIANFVGLALAAPSVRRTAMRRFNADARGRAFAFAAAPRT